jgi:uncharacterized membrane protein YdbT with pleckstrin-like domain
MSTYKASRFSDGNKLFPSVIHIDQQAVTFKIPGFFNGKETTIPMSRISSVDIETPLIGYSTLIVETTGDGSIRAHGYTKSEVKEMKQDILSKIL